jgi:hypothetical protein
MRMNKMNNDDIEIICCGKADRGKSDIFGPLDYPRPPPPKRKCRHGKKWRVNVSTGNMAGLNSFRCLKCNRLIMGAKILDKKGLALIEKINRELNKK